MDRTRQTLIGLALGIVLLVLAAMLVQFLGQTEGLDRTAAAATRVGLAQTAQAVTATAATIPTLPATPLPPDVVALTPTQSNYDLLLALALEWPLVAQEPFDNNGRGWGIGPGGSRSTGERSIEDGRYLWDITAIENFTWTSAPIAADHADFYLAVRADRMDRQTGSQNLVFRFVDSDNYYDFGICSDGGSFQVWRNFRGDWKQLIGCTADPALRPNESNRLAVIAQRDRYLLYANDRYLTTFSDALLTTGNVGVSIDLDAGQANLLLFDDFELRAPLMVEK